MKMFNPPHPGRALESCFDDQFTVEDAARKMGVSVNSLLDIIESSNYSRNSFFVNKSASKFKSCNLVKIAA